MKILFLGSADFGIPALEKLIEFRHEIVGIITTPPKPKGRGLSVTPSPVAQYAAKNNLAPVLTPEKFRDDKFLNRVKALSADLFVVVAFRILPEELFSIPTLGTVNIHASLLPKFRGAAPIQRAIQAGEVTTGVTVFRIDKGIDTGNIITTKSLSIGTDETTPELYSRLQILGADALIETVEKLSKGTVNYLEQDTENASPAPKLKKSEAHINWNSSAHDIYNQIRAFKPFPGSHTLLDGKILQIEWAQPSYSTSNYNPGTVCAVSSEGFSVQCRESILEILEVKPEGKKKMSAHAFLLGRKLNPGQELQ